jgi:predicted CXXCH cytochrome family protein
MDATMSGNTALWGISRLCMSCHDGTVAVDSYGGGTGSNTMASVTAWQTVGANYRSNDISQEHPISVPPTDTLVRNTPSDAATAYFGGNVECASCHDVHDQSGQSNLLVMNNAASAMCLSCHDK